MINNLFLLNYKVLNFALLSLNSNKLLFVVGRFQKQVDRTRIKEAD